MTVKRPALRYYGGKWRVAPKIIKWFPPHKIYVEPFGGAASVLLRKEPVKIEVYNDTYSDVVNFFKVMRDQAGDLLFRLYYTPHSREEYVRCLEYTGDDPVELARVFFVKSHQSIQGAGCKITATSWRASKTEYHYPLHIDNILDVVDRLKSVYIECSDFRDIINRYDTAQTLFYVDPPYLLEGGDYSCSLFEQDHIDLARELNGVKGYVILSATDSDLYRELYADWIWEPLKVQGAMASVKTEYLIMNYDFIDDDDA